MGGRYGCDFGASAWFPGGGLAARAEARAILEATLDRLVADGITVVRLFLLCDGRSGIRFDEVGAPIGFDETFFRDTDAALDAAAARGIGLIPVLFDFHLCDVPEVLNGVLLGGHSDLVIDPRRRDALLTDIVGPLVSRYSGHPAVLAWDLINEPEWCIWGIGTLSRARGVPAEDLRTWLGELTACVHSCAPQPVTVGSAGTAYLDFVRDLGLDFYQVHWYAAVRLGGARRSRRTPRAGSAGDSRRVSGPDLRHHPSRDPLGGPQRRLLRRVDLVRALARQGVRLRAALALIGAVPGMSSGERVTRRAGF